MERVAIIGKQGKSDIAQLSQIRSICYEIKRSNGLRRFLKSTYELYPRVECVIS